MDDAPLTPVPGLLLATLDTPQPYSPARIGDILAGAGWLLTETDLVGISVGLNDLMLGPALTGLPRPDVATRFPTWAQAGHSGFSFTVPIPADTQPGPDDRLILHARTTAGIRIVKEIPLTLVTGPAQAEPHTPPSGAQDIRFAIDSPALSGDRATETVRGLLTVSGWALAPDGIDSVEILVDEASVGAALLGLRREDVAATFPTHEGARLSGFALTLPRLVGEHTITVVFHGRNGRGFRRGFHITAESAQESGARFRPRERLTDHAAAGLLADFDRLGHQPAFTVLLHQGEADSVDDRLASSLESLLAQAYGGWRAVVLLDPVAQEVFPPSGRVRVAALDTPLAALLDAAPGWVLMLRLGDRLGADALLRLALEAALHPAADFVYADERLWDPALGAMQPWFKPDFSPDLLLSTPYLGRAWCAASGLLAQAGVADQAFPARGDHDVTLRLTEAARNIRHVPELLLEQADGPAAPETADAVRRALRRRGIDGTVSDGLAPGTFRVTRTAPGNEIVSIIIPTCGARRLIQGAILSLRERTAYRRFDIVCVDSIPADQPELKAWLRAHADRVIEPDTAFNWSRYNNLAVAAARGSVLLFLNDDIEVIAPDWLDALLEHARRPEVGVVGGLLLYPDGTIQHAGMFLDGRVGRHAFRHAPGDDGGPFGLARTLREVTAVTGACLMMRRDVFDRFGGFHEGHGVVNNDLDFCLRVGQAGLRVIYTPFARLTHHELASRAGLGDVFDRARFDEDWRAVFLAGDPYHNPNLSKRSEDFSPDPEPIEVLRGGGPLRARARVRRILVVKLDHIGDFVLAFPALRRLRERFAGARICVLGAKASRALIRLEPAIDEFLEFAFFHERSGEDATPVEAAALAGLGEVLRPYHFDIAVDLRMQGETRAVLPHTGAGLLAGFDRDDAFPFLDVALEWEGDAARRAKRVHVSDRLVQLVDAIATACDSQAPAVAWPAATTALLAELAGGGVPAGFFDHGLVCVHAAAGSDMKQWPVGHFSALIDRLVEQAGLRVVLIGIAAEAAVVDAVVALVRRPDCVVSLVGRVDLDVLPHVLRACRLYVGNDSGPKHLAAALGVATVGIHASNVDAVEWAAVGARAVTIRRRVACGPCYIARPTDCHRGLYCLRSIGPGEVFRACQELLGLTAGPA